MVAIRTIDLRISTSPEDTAGTDGDVYLGVAGREFRIETVNPPNEDLDDFQPGQEWTYILGEWPPVVQPDIPHLEGQFLTSPKTKQVETQLLLETLLMICTHLILIC